MASSTHLSLRAQEAAKPKDLATLYEVFNNPWSEQYDDGYINLGVAENTLAHEALSAHIQNHIQLDGQQLTYGDGANGSKRLRTVLAQFLSKQLDAARQIQPSEITVTNGCSSAIEHLSWAFANPGEAFLLGQPYYGTFLPDLSLRTGTKVVPVPFHGLDPLSDEAVSKYEEALIAAQVEGTKTAGIMLCNPHNPLGRCYSKRFLTRMMKLCQKYRIQLISDEIYALSVWDNTIDNENSKSAAFTSILSMTLPPGFEPSRLTVIWGMSKDFGANGIRIGAIISPYNAPLHQALLSVCLYSSPSSISEHVTANILSDEAWVNNYLAKNQISLKKKHEHVVRWARANKIPYKPGVNAAFFIWVDLGSLCKALQPGMNMESIEQDIKMALLRNKVFLASGTGFGSEEPGWFRIVFSHHTIYLDRGLDRIVKSLHQLPQWKELQR